MGRELACGLQTSFLIFLVFEREEERSGLAPKLPLES